MKRFNDHSTSFALKYSCIAKYLTISCKYIEITREKNAIENRPRLNDRCMAATATVAMCKTLMKSKKISNQKFKKSQNFIRAENYQYLWIIAEFFFVHKIISACDSNSSHRMMLLILGKKPFQDWHMCWTPLNDKTCSFFPITKPIIE